MCKCLLCRKNEANKKGSHIIPSFLMKRVNGFGERDHEIGFVMKNGIANVYFGRDIYEEQRNEFTDNEEKLESRENYDVRDNVFCSDCEKYFASLETKYAPSLNLSLTESNITKNTKVLPIDAMLFWCSVVWRILATHHLNTRTNPDIEERLRFALDNKSIEGLNMYYKLLRCKDYAIRSKNGTCVRIDIKEDFILLIVDDFILAMYFNTSNHTPNSKLFGIKLPRNGGLNVGYNKEEINPLTDEQFCKVIQIIIRDAINDMQLCDKFRYLHRIYFGKEIPLEVLSDTIDMISKTGKLGDIHTIEHYCSCYKNALQKYGII